MQHMRRSLSVPSFQHYAHAHAQDGLSSQHSFSFPVDGLVFDPRLQGNSMGPPYFHPAGEVRPTFNRQRQDSSVHLGETFSANPDIASKGNEPSMDENHQEAAHSTSIDIPYGPENERQNPIHSVNTQHGTHGERQPKINDLPFHIRLYQVALTGDWDKAKSVIDVYPSVVRVPLTGTGRETALHIAAAAKQTTFVEKLVGKIKPTDLALRNKFGYTPLCFAAASGIVRISEVMVKENGGLPLIRGRKNATPLYLAVTYKRRDMASYLFSKTDFTSLSIKEKVELLHATISSDYYDTGLQILQEDPNLAFERDDEGETALHALARKQKAIGSRSQLRIWEKCINFCFKGFYSKAMMTLAHQMVESLWKAFLEKMLEQDMLEFIKTPSRFLHEAAKIGNVEFFIVLIRLYPDLIWKVDDDCKSIFHAAVENRQESIFKLIYEIGGFKDFIANFTDTKNSINMLHLAANIAAPNHLNRVSGAALQMQRELLWFKEVEKIVKPSHRDMKTTHLEPDPGTSHLENKIDQLAHSVHFNLERRGYWLHSGLSRRSYSVPSNFGREKDSVPPNQQPDGLTPRELFTRKHKQLRKAGEEWMKCTSNSCMLVATLIATVVFAAAFMYQGATIIIPVLLFLGREIGSPSL